MGGGYPFVVVTDSEDIILREFDNVIVRSPERTGFMSKLMIDLYTPFEETIFIDADCLVGNSIDWWFEAFSNNGSPVSVFGWNIAINETLENPDDYYFKYEKCKELSVNYIPSFNGGVYYLKQGVLAKKVFSDARKFVDTNFDGGFLCYGDEPNIALAMAINGCKCLSINQILVYPRAKIDLLDMRAKRYRYEQFEKKYTDLGVIHFGSKHTKKMLYRYWITDMNNRNSTLWSILYKMGFYKNPLKLLDIFRDKIIHCLVIIKHMFYDKAKKLICKNSNGK